jgi:ATP synthase protein I
MASSGRRKPKDSSDDGGKYSAAAGGTANPEGTGGYNAGMVVFSYIIGGILVWSLIGWGLDILLGTRWFVLAGAFVGLAGSFYLSFARRFRSTRINNGADEKSSDADGNGTEQS